MLSVIERLHVKMQTVGIMGMPSVSENCFLVFSFCLVLFYEEGGSANK